MTEEHTLIDFVGLASQLTNEQKILACLERIEVLLQPTQHSKDLMAQIEASKAAEKPAPKKPFGRK